MRAFSTPPTEKRKLSLFVSEETFHQKLRVIGPMAMVCMELDALLPIPPLRAASTWSWVKLVLPTHGGFPFVVHVKRGVSSASARGSKGVTIKDALALTMLPAALTITTE